MPNWCSNNVTFYNEDVNEVNAFEEYLNEMNARDEEPGLFDAFVPRPVEEDDNWYDWNIANWGTKWEVTFVSMQRVDKNTIKLSFDTAWAPPGAFYETVARETSWIVSATYFEPGMAFVGRCIEGVDEFYEYSDIESLDTIPQDLVEEFGIREMMEEWESEEDEFGDDEMLAALNDLKKEFDNMTTKPKNAFDIQEGRDWLVTLLKERAVTVTFIKKDGTERVMKCSLSEEFVPFSEIDASSNGTRKKSDEALAVYDIESDGWRSFRWDSIVSIAFDL